MFHHMLPEPPIERVASLFLNNRSQAVRIPKEFELPGDTVTIVRQPDGSLLLRSRTDIAAFVAGPDPLGPDDQLDEVPDLDADDVRL